MESKKSSFRSVSEKLITYFNHRELVSSDAEKAAAFKGILEGISKRKKARRLRSVWTTAAMIAVVIGCVYYFRVYQNGKQIGFPNVVAQMMADSISSEEIQLIVSSDTVIPVDKGATVTFFPNSVNINNERVIDDVTSSSEVEYNRVVVPNGKYIHLVLADGSGMHVNAGTTVIIPKAFKKNKREIFVDGEVYLDVARNENAPFVVKTSSFDVEVLGTAFNINAYSHSIGSNEVVLVRGKVSVKSKAGSETTLLPNDKVKIYADGEMKKTVVDASDYTLWTQGILNLHVASLSNILIKLGRYYGVNITCESNIAHVAIAGKIDLDCGVEEALKRIADTGRFHVMKMGTSYHLKSQ